MGEEKEPEKINVRIDGYEFISAAEVLIETGKPTKEPKKFDKVYTIYQEEYVAGKNQMFARFRVWVQKNTYTIWKPGDPEVVVELPAFATMILRAKMNHLKVLDDDLKEMRHPWLGI